MRIGELSAKAGVNIQAIRFYEREKLLRKPARTASGYREFTEADLERLRFIKDSQQLGFSLKEIKELLEIHETATSFMASDGHANSKTWEKAFRIANDRLALINQKIEFLTALKKPLSTALTHPNPEGAMVCPATLIKRQPKQAAAPRRKVARPTLHSRKKTA